MVTVDTSPMRLQDVTELQHAMVAVAATVHCAPLPEEPMVLKPDAALVASERDQVEVDAVDEGSRAALDSWDEQALSGFAARLCAPVVAPSEQEVAAADARIAMQARHQRWNPACVRFCQRCC